MLFSDSKETLIQLGNFQAADHKAKHVDWKESLIKLGNVQGAEASIPPADGTFFKKSVRNKNMRKRAMEDSDAEGSNSGAAVVCTSRISRKNEGKLEFSSGATVSRPKQAEEEADEKKVGNTFFYESSRVIQTDTDQRATATNETETAFDRDARAIREKVLKQADEAIKGNSSQSSKVYKGISGYTDYKAGFRREHTIAGEKAGGSHGPLRASAHIRMSVRFDYQPDICKDYKETGYCGYGDSCKFLHDRGDYKSGWQMEKEWDEAEKRNKDRVIQGLADDQESKSDSEDEDELPFACFICREPFRDPVVTHCKHYFCEHCALKHHARNKTCFVCNKPTNGVFNTAHEIVKRMKEAKASEPQEDEQSPL